MELVARRKLTKIRYTISTTFLDALCVLVPSRGRRGKLLTPAYPDMVLVNYLILPACLPKHYIILLFHLSQICIKLVFKLYALNQSICFNVLCVHYPERAKGS